jgi:hypothetical protein
VDILTADTNTQVATKIQTAINQKYFAVPDYRGYLLRGFDNSAGNDPDSATRWSLVPGVIGDMVGTFQSSQNLQHIHPVKFYENAGDPSNYIAGKDLDDPVNEQDSFPEGGAESRPINQYVNYAIKY